jgi:hypothetical protein
MPLISVAQMNSQDDIENNFQVIELTASQVAQTYSDCLH